MSTTVFHTQVFPAAPDAVWEMLRDEDYIRSKGMRSGSLDVNAEITAAEDRTVIISRRRLPAKLPGFVKRFVGEVVTLTETQIWGDAAQDGTREAEFIVDFNGQPMSYSGTMFLEPEGAGTKVVTHGTIKASVPFVGGKIEGIAREWSEKYLDKEVVVSSEWLAGERA